MSRTIGNILEEAATLRARYSSGVAASQRATISSEAIVAALDQFMECVRYLNTRRSENTLALDSEAAVQDALYLILRPWVTDLVPETPTDRVASRYTIKDFVSLTARVILEAKYIRDREHGRSVSKEIHDDIETYRHDSRCDSLIFFIYDPNALIPDQAALKRQVETTRTYDKRVLTCRLVVVP